MTNYAIIRGRPGTSELKQGWPLRQVTGELLFPGSLFCLAPLNPEENMNKDPAFLFYSRDFLSETTFLTDSQTGKFIKILCTMHIHGHLSRKHMLTICNRFDEKLFSLFKQDSDYLFYNEQLEDIMQKRKAYINTRKENASHKHKPSISSAHGKHPANETENANLKGEGRDFLKDVDGLV